MDNSEKGEEIMAKRITTVCGDIAPEQLGFTSMHDHTFVDLSLAGAFMEAMFAGMPSQMLAFTPENYAFLKNGSYLANKELQVVDDLELLVKEYSLFKAAGGSPSATPAPSDCGAVSPSVGNCPNGRDSILSVPPGCTTRRPFRRNIAARMRISTIRCSKMRLKTGWMGQISI